MRYTKPVDLWDPAIYDAIQNGNLRLQSGQWVYCGDRTRPSRFHHVDIDKNGIRYICAFHYPRASKGYLAYTSRR